MHQIRQHIINVNCSSEPFGKEVNANLSYVLEKEFYPKLEIIFNQYSEEDQIWLIDNLEIEITDISEKDWKNEIVKKSLMQIENFLKLNQHKNSTSEISEKEINSKKLSIGNYAEQLFSGFLKTGQISENSLFADLKSITAEIKISEIFYQKILDIFKNQHQTILRWIFSVPMEFRNEIYRFIHVKNEYLELINVLRTEDSEERKRFSELLMLISLNEIIRDQNVFEFLNHSAKKYWKIEKSELSQFLNSDLNLDKEELNFTEKWKRSINSEQKNSEVVESKTEKEEYIYIENAGLTILHPFFTALFEQLDLVEKEVWKSDTDIHKAVLLMHFLVFGNEVFEEDKMILNKILCGLPPDEVINVNLFLSADEKEACEDLLDAVIQHWSVMNKSSTEALRETFLQRSGKLDFKNENSELWIESKGVDILLDQIPWGISTLKTPWMEHLLFCHWNQ